MTDTIENNIKNLPEDPSKEEKIEALEEHMSVLEDQNDNLQDQLVEVNSENTKLQQQLERLTHENKKLKQNPLFVATVQEIIPDENEALVKQHGNNQEIVTEVTDELCSELQPEDRVAINNSLAVVKQLSNETNMKARVMQVNHSPDTAYDDIGGLTDKIREMRESVELALDDTSVFDDVGITPPNGVLMYGPPGTGKTMLAKAVANETDATFIRLSGSDLVKKFIGEGAKLVRDLFEVAKENTPAIVFIDEIDAIASERSESKTNGGEEVQRTLLQLLSEMDGFDDRGDIRIIGATNRYDMLDSAILRPGRFDRLVEVGKPDVDAREQILRIHTRDMNIADDVSLENVAEKTESATGAEIEALCTEAGMFAIREDRTTITEQDLLNAYGKVQREKEAKDELVSGPAFA